MNHKGMKIYWIFAVDLVIILSMVLSNATVVTAASTSPFVGRWSTVDVDGSDIRLAIAQTGSGKFKITWTENYISFCDGGPGLIQGTGWLNAENPLLLEADLNLKCFTTGAALDFFHVWRYHQNTGMLSSSYDGGVLIWSKSGRRYPPAPRLDLRVNYGDNWVESFYEAGHTVWVMVTDGDGAVKATAELMTEPKDFWNGETGFQTFDSVWYDGSGNPMGTAPDIQPYDWVFGWVDNGAASKVQIGDIRGVVDVEADSVEGTILAPWFSSEVVVECHPWGAPEPEDLKYDSILPDGADRYSCSWSSEWDIQSENPVGVSYFGPDGHWVANSIRNPRFTVFPEWNWLEGWEWQDGSTITATVDSKPECIAEGTAGYLAENPWSTFVGMNFPEGCDVEAGDVMTLSDGTTSLSHTIENLAVTNVDENENIVAGTADTDKLVNVWVHGFGEFGQQPTVIDGNWTADFDDVGFDLQGGMAGRSEIRDDLGNGTAVDWYVPRPRMTIFPEGEWFDGMDWPDGATVAITVADKPECTTSRESWGFFFNGNFPEGCDIVLGDTVTFSTGPIERTHTVQNLAVTDVDKAENTVAGLADEGALVYLWAHETQGGFELPVGVDGTWMADFDDIGIDLVETMGGRSEIRDKFGNATAVDWYIPNPHFTVFPEWEWFDGMEWPDGAAVDISVVDKPECTTAAESWGFFFNGSFPEGCDIVIGDIVTFTDGETIRTHSVQNLAITDVDKVENTVAGIADDSAVVLVWAHGLEGGFELPVGVSGAWLADFDDKGIDLVENMGGRSEIRDEYGNATAVDWWIPNPRFVIFPEWNWFDGLDWPDGSTVEITVEGKSECLAWKLDILENFFNGGFSEECDIVPGDVLTFTDGETIRTHTVRNLAIIGSDAIWDTVSGSADAGAELTVWPYDYGDVLVNPIAGEDHIWTADFGAVGIDLLPGMAGRAEIADDFGNLTTVEWAVPVTMTVTSAEDVLANDGFCTLREAVIAANTNSPSGDMPGECPAGTDIVADTIALAGDQTYALTIDSTYEDGALDGDLDLWNNSAPLDLIITVEDGLAVISQDAVVDDRVINNLGAVTNLEHLTLTGGNIASDGGGIAIWGGTVTLTNSVISGNMADWGGGISVIGSALILDDSIVTGSVSQNDGGGIFMRHYEADGMNPPVPSTVTINNGSQIVNNTASWGGGISSWNSTLAIDASSVSTNTADNSGGGILVHEGGSVTIQNGATISGNTAQWGAGISNWDAAVTITDSILANNAAASVGGGLENSGLLTVLNTAFLNNTAGYEGSAVWSFTETPYDTAVTHSCIVGNTNVYGNTAVWNNTTSIQNFTFNWWGDPSGPGGVGGGLGDGIGPFIDFMPFLIGPLSICL